MKAMMKENPIRGLDLEETACDERDVSQRYSGWCIPVTLADGSWMIERRSGESGSVRFGESESLEGLCLETLRALPVAGSDVRERTLSIQFSGSSSSSSLLGMGSHRERLWDLDGCLPECEPGVKEENCSDPSVHGGVWLNVQVAEHGFDVLSVHFDNWASNANNVNTECAEGTEEAIGFDPRLGAAAFVVVPGDGYEEPRWPASHRYKRIHPTARQDESKARKTGRDDLWSMGMGEGK